MLRELGKPENCDQVWVADTTYLRTAVGWCYLATVMDLFSRRIIGWSVSMRNDSKLCCRALQTAVLTRGGDLPQGLIHHSDRGSTYASYDYEAVLDSHGIRQSMSAKGNCYDNAAMESFFGRFKIGSVGDILYADEEHARSAAFEYIETFYNRFRKHSSLGYKGHFTPRPVMCWWPIPSLHGLRSVAPLKPRNQRNANRQTVGSPRTPVRGSVEACCARWPASSSCLHGLRSVAPLKRARVACGLAGIGKIRGIIPVRAFISFVIPVTPAR